MSRTLKPLSLERDVREHPKVPHAPRDFLIVFKSFFRKPYVFWLIGIFFIYLALAIAISGFYNTIPLILRYAQTVNWLELGLSIVFSLIIGALVAFNLVAVHLAYKERLPVINYRFNGKSARFLIYHHTNCIACREKGMGTEPPR